MPKIILQEIFSQYKEIHSGMSTKLGSSSKTGFEMNLSFNVGDDPSAVIENRRIFLSQIGIETDRLAIPVQIHSNTVIKVDSPGEYQLCDALITNKKNVALAITIADCVPVLLFDPEHKTIGAVHAGWKGTANSIVEKAIMKMKEEYNTNPAKILAFIGPSAGQCCYEVGEDVAVMFKEKIVHYDNSKAFVDLKTENKLQLQHLGVPSSNIEVSSYCTVCEKDMFHSHRRDAQISGRMMAVICIVL